MERLFGTDGIRGTANQPPMTSHTAMAVGQALAAVIRRHESHRPKILIGKDTRLSGYMIESALASGMCSMGADVILAGPIPTPAVAFLTRNMNADAGVVISASHNPFQDNGIKIFNQGGYKLNDGREREIENLIAGGALADRLPEADRIGKAARCDDALGRYMVFLRHSLPVGLSLEGMKIAVDCANGATYRVAPNLLAEMRAEVLPINVSPDGRNINKNSGSLHPDILAETVRSRGADLGLAFDGDGDRLIAVDEQGGIVTGDRLIAICAVHMKDAGTLANNTVVTTVMSNLGLSECLASNSIQRVEAPVGDRYVLERMLGCGAVLGGEDSGHIIFSRLHTTGDGLLSALYLLSVMAGTGKKLSELASVMKTYPQMLENVPVKNKIPLEDMPSLLDEIADVERSLDGRGRVLVRYSGTEPILRVMAEAPTREQTEQSVRRIVEAAKSQPDLMGYTE